MSNACQTSGLRSRRICVLVGLPASARAVIPLLQLCLRFFLGVGGGDERSRGCGAPGHGLAPLAVPGWRFGGVRKRPCDISGFAAGGALRATRHVATGGLSDSGQPRISSLHVVGHAKRQMEQEDEQGWSFTDGWVCTGCVDDYALGAILADATAEQMSCSFCGAEGAADLDVLVEAFVRGIRHEYEDALDGVAWDGREGGFQWDRMWDTWDLVGDFEDVFIGDGLLDAVRHAVHDATWVERNFAERRRDEVLAETWAEFSQVVKYETRYVIWLRDDQDRQLGAGEISPARILGHVGGLIERLGLVREVPAGTRFWRAQPHDEASIECTPGRLGTAPRQVAKQPNRMSPAGIPMFYGAVERDTAVREVAVGSDVAMVTWAQFVLSTPAAVVDFTLLPGVPSIFDPQLGSLRRQLIFLHEFVGQLSEPARREFEEIDYVPTQILTEYLLHVHRGSDVINGLFYSSSITGDPCAVLDIPNERCVDQPMRLELELVLDPDTVGRSPIEPAWR